MKKKYEKNYCGFIRRINAYTQDYYILLKVEENHSKKLKRTSAVLVGESMPTHDYYIVLKVEEIVRWK